jgi:hypothetical protein
VGVRRQEVVARKQYPSPGRFRQWPGLLPEVQGELGQTSKGASAIAIGQRPLLADTLRDAFSSANRLSAQVTNLILASAPLPAVTLDCSPTYNASVDELASRPSHRPVPLTHARAGCALSRTSPRLATGGGSSPHRAELPISQFPRGAYLCSGDW